MPDGFVPDITPGLDGDDLVASVARALFASRNQCAAAIADHLLGHPDLEQQFDAIMDEVAADPLDDSITWAGLDADHLTGPVRVFDVTGAVIDHKFIPTVVAAHLFCYAPAEGTQ